MVINVQESGRSSTIHPRQDKQQLPQKPQQQQQQQQQPKQPDSSNNNGSGKASPNQGAS